MKTAQLFRALLLLAALLLPHFAASAQDCSECIERKRSACAQECRLVPPANAVRCQKDCSWQYCSHRCEENDPALLADPYSSCTACLDQQYNLCESNCPTGTDRARSACQLTCAKERCGAWCPKPTPAPSAK